MNRDKLIAALKTVLAITQATGVYENKYGRFRIVNNTDSSKSNWVVDWFNGKDIKIYPDGDNFRSKLEAIQWIKSLAPTKVLHERNMPTDGTWADLTKKYESHEDFPQD